MKKWLMLLAMTGSMGAVAQDGLPDSTFGIDGRSEFIPDGTSVKSIVFNAVASFPDGSLLAGGYMDRGVSGSPHPDYRVFVARLLKDGSPDAEFGNVPGQPGVLVLDQLDPRARIQEVRAIAPLADGGAIIGGAFDAVVHGGFTLRLDAQGHFVSGYGTDGVSLVPFQISDIALDSQGRVVVAGEAREEMPAYHGVVARFDGTTGAPDPTFGGDGVVDLLEYAEDGSVLDHQGSLAAVAVLPDDKVVVAGWQQQDGFVTAFSLAKLVDGSFDTTFAGGGWARFVPAWTDTVNGLARLVASADGTLLAAGSYLHESGGFRPVFARFDVDGMVVPSFGEPDFPGFRRLDVRDGFQSQFPTGLVEQDDGRIVFTATTVGGPAGEVPEFVAGRFHSEGGLDASFGTDGISIIATPAPSAFADARALTLQHGVPVIAGANGRPLDPSTAWPLVVRGSVLRLGADRLFGDGFERSEAETRAIGSAMP